MDYPKFNTGITENARKVVSLCAESTTSLAWLPWEDGGRQFFHSLEKEQHHSTPNPAKGIVLAILFSVPFWLTLGFLLAK